MFKFDSEANTYSLAHGQPLLAGWDSAAGWNTDPVSQNGDPVYTEAAVFDVEMTAPRDLIFATSGSTIAAGSADDSAVHYASGPSRDFVMTASPDFVVSERSVGETTVRSYALPGSEVGAQEVLDDGAQALAVYNDLIGQYPYEELDLAQVNIGNGAGGVEFPGLVFIGSVFYEDEYLRDSTGPGLIEFVVVHEVAHQWFYNVVGNNQYLHAFMDEALANYLSVTYYAATYGAEEADHQANLQLRIGYFSLLFQRGDEVVDQPTDDFASMQDYGATIYGKGALAFMALRAEIGTDAFFGALQQYFRDYAFKVAQPEDMRAEFEASSGQNLDAFWKHWFESADGRDDFDATDLARVLRDVGR
jgi:aminopeptidase N